MEYYLENCYSESTANKLKIKTQCIIPSGSWIRKQIAKIPQEKMIVALSDGIDQTITHQKKYHKTYKTFQLITRNVGELKQDMHVWEGSDQRLLVGINP